MRSWTLRMAALLAGASFGVHQLRFVVAYGSRAGRALEHQGHAYLSVLAPVVIGALMIAVAEVAARFVRGGHRARVPSLDRLWAVSTAALVGAYCLQELAEGALAPGHPVGLAGVFGAGGWLALPLALAAGLGVALLMRGSVAVVPPPGRRLARPAATAVRALPAPFEPAGAVAAIATSVRPRAPPAGAV